MQHRHHRLARNGVELFFEVAHAGLARIAFDHFGKRGLVHFELAALEPGLLQYPRQQMVFGNLQFFAGDIPAEADDFHAIQQRRRYGIQLVGGAHE